MGGGGPWVPPAASGEADRNPPQPCCPVPPQHRPGHSETLGKQQPPGLGGKAQPGGAINGGHQHPPWLMLQRGPFPLPKTPENPAKPALPSPTRGWPCGAVPAFARCLHSTRVSPRAAASLAPSLLPKIPGRGGLPGHPLPLALRPLPARPRCHRRPPGSAGHQRPCPGWGSGGGHTNQTPISCSVGCSPVPPKELRDRRRRIFSPPAFFSFFLNFFFFFFFSVF